MKQRIDYIDLAKGFCIILVVFFHCNCRLKNEYPFDHFLMSFRMPLYFVLSGLFFKTYEGLISFVKRKVNKILIPFIFFYLLANLIIPTTQSILKGDFSINWTKAMWVFTGDEFANVPIWFLLCLFNTNILFYITHILASQSKRFLPTLITGNIILGCIGFILSRYEINLPLYFDTALTVLPFFAFGYILRAHSSILYRNKNDKYCYIAIPVLCIITFLLANGHIDYRINYFELNIASLYICGMFGTLMVLFIAKAKTTIPGISYWGRYSIIILVTHSHILTIWGFVLNHIPNSIILDNSILKAILWTTLTLVSYFGIIPLCIKYLPYVTAQKDIIKVE